LEREKQTQKGRGVGALCSKAFCQFITFSNHSMFIADYSSLSHPNVRMTANTTID
jgi:hypothetical protein